MQWRQNEFESDRGTRPRKAPENFFVVRLHFFGSKSTIGRFGERFRDGQYSLICFCLLFFYSRCPPCPAICKSGAHAPVPYGVGVNVQLSLHCLFLANVWMLISSVGLSLISCHVRTHWSRSFRRKSIFFSLILTRVRAPLDIGWRRWYNKLSIGMRKLVVIRLADGRNSICRKETAATAGHMVCSSLTQIVPMCLQI